MQNAIKTDLQKRNSAPFLNLINPLVTAGTFCLSLFFKIRVIHRFHVKTGIQNSKHFDVFYPYLRKNNVDNLKRNGLWNTLDANNSEIKEENACFILMTTYNVLCKEYSRVWMILLFIWQNGKQMSWGEQEGSGVVDKCLCCPWFLTGTTNAGLFFFTSTNTSLFSGLWSGSAAQTASGYEEHLKGVSPVGIRKVEPLQPCK